MRLVGNGKLRKLTLGEMKAICAIAGQLGPAGDQVVRDAAAGEVESVNEDDSILVFHLPGYRRPPYEGEREFPVQGKVRDEDGVEVRVLLLNDQDERLFQLELIRLGDGPVIGPDWGTFEVVRQEVFRVFRARRVVSVVTS
jgi:hypothetical protein